MRIQNNITAMNTHRMYTINNNAVAKSAEKLSSGYRINRAGDDAAGLAISEKMRSQIRGLNMASKNSQDAVSLIQTAEGALQEVHSMLQRMNELANQAATGTNETFDREQIDAEFNQLKAEIDQVADTTTFNNMKLLDGSLASDAANVDVDSAASGLAVGKTLTTASGAAYTITNQTGLSDKVGTYGIAVKSGSVITVTFTDAETGNTTNTDIDLAKAAKDIGAGKAFKLDLTEAGLGIYEVTANSDTDVSATDLAAALAATTTTGPDTFAVTTAKPSGKVTNNGVTAPGTVAAINTGTGADRGAITFAISDADALMSALSSHADAVDGETYTFSARANGSNVELVATDSKGAELVLGSGAAAAGSAATNISIAGVDIAVASDADSTLTAAAIATAIGAAGAFTGDATYTAPANSAGKGGLKIQVGANEGDQLAISVAAMNTKGLNISNSTINDQTKAGEAITATQKAINLVSEQRATLGAMQNRLEHKIANLDNTSENLSAAESRIRDVDIAKEMTNFTKNNILSQAATAMLAQANAAPQGVLSLLQ